MLDVKDFNLGESQSSFDFKNFLLKILKSWYWFVLCLIITFLYAYNVNIRKEKIYGMQSSIVIKDESNPLFTSNTSLVFNWGGVSDKVQTIITTLKSRSHNEVVVDQLEYYVQYLKKGKYFFEDVYGAVPFSFQLNKNKGQLAGIPIKITFVSEKEYEVEVDFENIPSATLFHYSDLSSSQFTTGNQLFKKKLQISQPVNLPFLNGAIHLNEDAFNYVGQEFYLRFDDFNGTVGRYRSLDVTADIKAQSVVVLQLQGTNVN
ncbi:MAG: sugar transporter, partial [Flavobacterium sp.]|nr:sugar transporter [Flavobacterium sp.]